MRRYLFNRIIQGLILLLVGSLIIFLLSRLTGDPLHVMLSETATQEDYEIMERYLGLDKPLYVQYGIFLSNIVRGDFGKSIRYQRPVFDFIKDRFYPTLLLTVAAILVSVIIAIPGGVLAAINKNKWQDSALKVMAILGQSIPNFWLGLVLIQVFCVRLGWLPTSGELGIKYLILPAFTLGFGSTAGILRITRSAMLEIRNMEYVTLARIKGLSERLVIWKHSLRNALIPVVTFSGVIFARFLMGAVVTETVFSWPGLGRLAYEAVMNRDFPLIQGVVMVFIGIYIVFNLIIDVLYVYIDPRISYAKK